MNIIKSSVWISEVSD